MGALTMQQRVERMALALRNVGHYERPPTKRQPNPPLCWCIPIVAGTLYPPRHLGQLACELARLVLLESGVPQDPPRAIYGHLATGGHLAAHATPNRRQPRRTRRRRQTKA